MSLLGAFLRPKHLPSATKVIGCPHSSRKRSLPLAQASEVPSIDRNHANNVQRAPQWRARVNAKAVEEVFIQALVQASSCNNCNRGSTPRNTTLRGSANITSRPWNPSPTILPRVRAYSAPTHPKRAASKPIELQEEVRGAGNTARLGKPLNREAYVDLANTYESPPAFWQKLMRLPKPAPLPKSSSNHIPLAPRLVLTAEQESRPPYRERYILPPEDEEHAQQLERLKRLLRQGPRFHPIRQQAWKVYQTLRKPRPRYIDDGDMQKLLRNLTWVEFKTLDSSKRFFSVLDECVLEGVRLTAGEWNTAISFAGRWAKHVSTEDVKTAVETWMRMENHGVTADHVTFNVLFDVAIRAGRFALADTIYEELKARELPLNRYFFTSMIYYAGLRRNGDAVRQAFRQLVNAGEIVDTAIMNCVILSLVRAGEPASAWAVFQKMKELHAAKFGVQAPANWVERRYEGKRLHQFARRFRKEREAHEASFFGSLYSTEQQKEEAQRAAPIHPDRRTFEILIRYHALGSGNFEAVNLLRDELMAGGWNLHGSVYFHLFGGFERHGGHPGSMWKLEHLERLWQDFLAVLGPPPPPVLSEDIDATSMQVSAANHANSHVLRNAQSMELAWDSQIDPVTANEDLAPYFTPQLTIVLLKAFYACAGLKRAREVWKQVQDKWPEMMADERAAAQDVVDGFIREDGMYLV